MKIIRVEAIPLSIPCRYGAEGWSLGTDPVGSTPREFGSFMKAESLKWVRVIKEANMRME